MNFQYTVNPFSDEPIMLLNKHVGFDEEDGYGIMGDLFQAELLALDEMNPKRIQVWINSVGGIVVDGYSIFNAILKSKTPVDTYCVGIAASIAGVIFQAGRKRIMSDYGILMYHNPAGAENKSLDAIRESLIKMVCSKSGKNEEEVGKMMDRTTYIGADEAFSQKLCDEVETSTDFNKKHWKQVLNKAGGLKMAWSEANEIVNKHIDKNSNMALKKVTNKLKLNEDASEDSILAAIESIENRATAAENEVTTARADVTAANKAKGDMEDEMNKAKAKYDTLKAEYDKMCNDSKEVENKAKQEKAKNMVQGFAKVGRIKNEAKTIEKWTSLAVADFDGTKEMIEALPLNVKAPKIEEVVNKDDKGITLTYNAAAVMGEIAARTAKQ